MKKNYLLLVMLTLMGVSAVIAQNGQGRDLLTEEPVLTDLCFVNEADEWLHWKDNKYIILDINTSWYDYFKLATVVSSGDAQNNCEIRDLFEAPGGQGAIVYSKGSIKIINDILYFGTVNGNSFVFYAYNLNTKTFVFQENQLTAPWGGGFGGTPLGLIENGNYLYFAYDLLNCSLAYNYNYSNPLISSTSNDSEFVVFRTNLDFSNFEYIYRLKREDFKYISQNKEENWALQVSPTGKVLLRFIKMRTDNNLGPHIYDDRKPYHTRYVLIDAETKTVLQDRLFTGSVLMVPDLNDGFYVGFSSYPARALQIPGWSIWAATNYQIRNYIAHYDANWNETARSVRLVPFHNKVLPGYFNGISYITPFDDRILVAFDDRFFGPGSVTNIDKGGTMVLDTKLRRKEFYSGTLTGVRMMNRDHGEFARYKFSKNGYYAYGQYVYQTGKYPYYQVPSGGGTVYATLNNQRFPHQGGKWGFNYHYPFPDLSSYQFTPQLGTNGIAVLAGKGLGANGEAVSMENSSIVVTTETLTEGAVINPEYVLGGQPENMSIIYGQDYTTNPAGEDPVNINMDYKDYHIGVIRKDAHGNFFASIEINNQNPSLLSSWRETLTEPVDRANNGKYFRIYLSNNQSLSNNDENLVNAEVLVYPNPSKHKFFIKGIAVESDVKIYNIRGALVHQKTIAPTEAISTKKFASGLYIVKIQNAKGSVNRKLIVH